MRIPGHLPVYREPFTACPSMNTYTMHINELCQLQWDYTLDWPDGEQPKLWIFTYRCFQRADASAQFEEVDQAPYDIPLWEEVLTGISHHAAGVLYGSMKVVGPIVATSRDYGSGAEEAASKRYDMKKYRSMMLGGRQSK